MFVREGLFNECKERTCFFFEDVGDAVDDDEEEEDNAGVWYNNVSFRCNVVCQCNCFIPCKHINPDTVTVYLTQHNCADVNDNAYLNTKRRV